MYVLFTFIGAEANRCLFVKLQFQATGDINVQNSGLVSVYQETNSSNSVFIWSRIHCHSANAVTESPGSVLLHLWCRSVTEAITLSHLTGITASSAKLTEFAKDEIYFQCQLTLDLVSGRRNAEEFSDGFFTSLFYFLSLFRKNIRIRCRLIYLFRWTLSAFAVLNTGFWRCQSMIH